MEVFENYDLTKLNTFGVPARAKLFAVIENEEDLKELFANSQFKNHEKLFLGGGSNVLFTKDFDGMVVLNHLKGIEILEAPTPQGVGVPTESVGKNEVLIRAMAGEIWHDLVTFSVERGLWGIENLSLVPGTVGAAPMQNIGAYGVELKSTLVNVEAYEVETGAKKIFQNAECEFGYRDSIFKNKLKGKYFISAITLKLSKVEKKNITYRILQEYLKKNKVEVKKSKDISDAVASIRRSKLPDPKVIGNAGSFFKNLFVTPEKLEELRSTYSGMPSFEEEGGVKIPSAWLIEECGWKGKRVGNVGVHDKQALVLVNHGGGTGEEIKNLSEQIISSVFAKFGLKLTLEVNFI
ncbi:MAG: UDP-N-acetylmuramate dehydrogenase [bacterium]|nr:UDP-N-acetylmuramate dehydrogenase [bacterium]